MAGIGNSGGGERIWRERVKKMKGQSEGGRNFHYCYVGVSGVNWAKMKEDITAANRRKWKTETG